MKTLKIFIALLGVVLLLSSCGTMYKTEGGALGGAIVKQRGSTESNDNLRY